MLPLNDYPHIRDTILALAPYASLLSLRGASHDLRDRADAALLAHISLAPRPSADIRDRLSCVRDGEHRLPRAGWLDSPLAGAVRVLDIHTPSDAVSVRKAHEQMRFRAEEACWCGPDAGTARALQRLAPRLTGLRMLRRWGVHFCPTFVRAPRLLTFYPPAGQPPYTYLAPAPVHVVHIALGGMWDPDVLVDAWETEPEPEDGPVHFVFRFSEGRQAGEPDQRAEHAFILLTDTVAGLVANGRRVTLVAPERWLPVWHRFPEWRTAQDIAWARQAWAAEVAETVSFAEGTFGLGRDAAERVDRLFEILGEAEYRAAVGEEVYAFERYSLPLR